MSATTYPLCPLCAKPIGFPRALSTKPELDGSEVSRRNFVYRRAVFISRGSDVAPPNSGALVEGSIGRAEGGDSESAAK